METLSFTMFWFIPFCLLGRGWVGVSEVEGFCSLVPFLVDALYQNRNIESRAPDRISYVSFIILWFRSPP